MMPVALLRRLRAAFTGLQTEASAPPPLATLSPCTPADLVDAAWYRARYPEAADDPLRHYAKHGRAQGYDPNPWFSTDWYIRQHPDAAPDPLAHFVATNARPHPHFDLGWYSRRYLHARPSASALAHFLHTGIHDGAVPDPRLDRIEVEDRVAAAPRERRAQLLMELQQNLRSDAELCQALVDEPWYRGRYFDAAASDTTAAEHYRCFGASLGYDPNPWFSTTWYRIRHRATAHGPALQHFVETGAAAGLQPSPFFDVGWYARQYLRLRSPHAAALLHFISDGCLARAVPEPGLHNPETFRLLHRTPPEQRCAVLVRLRREQRNEVRLLRSLVDRNWYAVRYGIGQDAAVHYHAEGWKNGFDPNPWFASRWYLKRNPRLSGGDVSPLEHFIVSGASAGQKPHPDVDLRSHAQRYLGSAASANAFEHFLLLQRAASRA